MPSSSESQADLNRRIMRAFQDAEEARIRLLGVLAVLVEDGIISSGRARELGAMTIDEQRAYLRAAYANHLTDVEDDEG